MPRAHTPLAALPLLLAACADDPPAATVERPSVVLIAIDTLRADKLGCYGSGLGLSPALDALAAEGARFAHAFAHAPWTLPSFASLLTSLHPEEHGAGGALGAPFRALADEAETLPEILRAAGWRTHAIVNVDFLGPSFGVGQGFEELDARFSEDNRVVRDAKATTDAALAFLDAHARERFLLFVHYFDPHAEYAPPAEWRARFAAPQDREGRAFEFGTRGQIARHRAGVARLPEDGITRAEKLYEAEIAYTDHEVGRLLAGLDARGLGATTLVVVTADHGEEFLDHGDYEHGHTLYDELLRVPLILRQPGRIAPRAIEEPVAHVDVAPTLCALLGVAPGDAFSGRDLRALLSGGVVEAEPLTAFGNFWGAPWRSLREQRQKLILVPAGPQGARAELYDWRADPRETRDLAAGEAAAVAGLGAELDALARAYAAAGLAGSRAARPSAEELERLRGFGYVGEDEPAGDGAGSPR